MARTAAAAEVAATPFVAPIVTISRNANRCGRAYEVALVADDVNLGVESMEIMSEMDLLPSVESVVNKAKMTLSVQGILTSTIPAGTTPSSDYAPDFLLRSHPCVFPHGKGQRPAGMSNDTYFRTLFQRYPTEQFSGNRGFLVDVYDTSQRHNVNCQANLVLHSHPHLAAKLVGIKDADIIGALSCVGLSGEALHNKTSGLSKQSKGLMDAMKIVGARVPGSPQSKLSARSKAMALTAIFGSSTIMLNLCVTESSAVWTFEMEGLSYTFDAWGLPEGRLSPEEARRYIATHPFACATFFHCYLRAFCEVYLGWCLYAAEQTNPNCLFGVITSRSLSIEESGRGGQHCHGTLTQPLMQVRTLVKLMEQGPDMQNRLLEFAERFSAAYLPSSEPFRCVRACECACSTRWRRGHLIANSYIAPHT
jgi:hypothetical protein